ncbi:MAG TPA: helix-hairpin-helix domain-containing protein [bacterium]|nr:helix-hairpin-helix domain-containing protein [bacterium]
MLDTLTGRLAGLDPENGLVYLALGTPEAGFTFELQAPPSTARELQRLDPGTVVTVHTIFEILAQGPVGSLKPRLFAFSSDLDKRFFLKLTTVKGVGASVALEMMSAPTGQIALAIENKDERFLRTLPRIGASKAKLLIAELSEKVQPFRADGDIPAGVPEGMPIDPVGQVAMAILVRQLDLDEREAAQLIARTRELHPDIAELDELLQALFEVRGVK